MALAAARRSPIPINPAGRRVRSSCFLST
jgi:hypothetical protein